VNENMEDNSTNINSSENNELSLCFKSYAHYIQYFAYSKFCGDDKIPIDTNAHLNAKLQMFTSGRSYSLDSDPLKTWTKLSLNAPYMNLARIAIDTLFVPATSVVVERLFFRMCDIMSAKKNRLLAVTLVHCASLSSWGHE
jgi:hAT family C-terminal dimerisation region